MYLQRSSCILCGEHIVKIKYNLKTTYSETSNVLLIKFVEKLYKNVFLLHCNICSLCYELLNELDSLQSREKQLYNKLKEYISKMQGTLPQSDDTCTDDSKDTLSFSQLFDNTQEVTPTHSEVDDIKIGDIDLKKLPIKVKRVSLSKPVNRESTHEINLDSNSKIKQETENQNAFEKIQSSIQLDLSKHVQEHMTKYKPDKDVLCEICGQNFKTKIGFENHMKKHGDAQDDLKILVMNKTDTDWMCGTCGKIFNQKVALTRHLFIHTGETRYQCEQCGKKFVHHSSFNMHKKIHAGERNFKCSLCNRGFLTGSHLKRHLRAAHSREKDHSCDLCGKKFAENYNLLAHIKIVHKQPTNLIEVKEVFYDV